jgi:hypothetical protein
VGIPGGAFSTGASLNAHHQTLNHWFNNCYIPVLSQATATSAVIYGSPQSAPSGGGPIVSGCQGGESPAWIQQPNFTLNQLNPSAPMHGIRGPEVVYVNASISRSFPIREGISIMFRADSYNVINNVQHSGGPNTSLTSTSFGVCGIGQSNDARYMRLRAVLSF